MSVRRVGPAAAALSAARGARARGAVPVGTGLARRIACAVAGGDGRDGPRLAALAGPGMTVEGFMDMADALADALASAERVVVVGTPYVEEDGVVRTPEPTAEECAAFNGGLLALPGPVAAFEVVLPDGGPMLLVAREVPSLMGGPRAIALRGVEFPGGGVVAPTAFETVLEVAGRGCPGWGDVAVTDEDGVPLDGEARLEALSGTLMRYLLDPHGARDAVARDRFVAEDLDALGAEAVDAGLTADAALLVCLLARATPADPSASN